MNFFSNKAPTALLFLFWFGCSNEPKQTVSEPVTNTIRIKGSDTEFQMVKQLAEAYMSEHPEIKITVEGGGSNKGIEALVNKHIDICNSSRQIKEYEMPQIAEKNVKPLPVMFSVDALAIITNYKVGVDSLPIDQVSRIYTGEVKNWKELGGDDLTIALFGRDKSSGTRDYFNEKFLLGKPEYIVKECATNKGVLTSVINTPGAIGYVGAGFLLDSTGKPNGKIWTMPIYIENHPAYSPYQFDAVKRGDYMLTRPLYQYVNGPPNEAIQNFILFELTKKGQDIVIRHGFFPINDYQTQINRLKGIIN